MVFKSNEIAAFIAKEVPKHSLGWIKTNLSLLAPLLANHDGAYKAFGPYWWQLKRLFKTYKVGKRHWFQGAYTEQKVLEACSNNNPIEDLAACLLYRSIHAYDTLGLHETHIVTWPDSTSGFYQVSDSDAGHQLDLFEADEHQVFLEQQYRLTPQNYLARPWRQRGDLAMQAGTYWLAVVCYQRSIAGTFDPSGLDRQDAWLQLADAFSKLDQASKAYFCYETLYERSKESWLSGYMAECLLSMGRYIEANTLFDQALQSAPDNPEFLAGKKRAFSRLQQEQQQSRSAGAQDLHFYPRATAS